MYERWLVGGAANVAQQGVPAAQASNTAANGARQAPPPWAVVINALALDAGSLTFSDKAGAKAVAFKVSGLQAKLAGLVLDDRAASKALVA